MHAAIGRRRASPAVDLNPAIDIKVRRLRTRYALNEAVKKDSPNATAKLTDIKMNPDGKMVTTKFTCTNCLHQRPGGDKKIVPSSAGEALVGLDILDKKWKFMDISLDNENGGHSAVHSDHIF